MAHALEGTPPGDEERHHRDEGNQRQRSASDGNSLRLRCIEVAHEHKQIEGHDEPHEEGAAYERPLKWNVGGHCGARLARAPTQVHGTVWGILTSEQSP
jgi:hypothetical protein